MGESEAPLNFQLTAGRLQVSASTLVGFVSKRSRSFSRDHMAARGVRQILRLRPPSPSISHFGWRNPLPLFARARAHATPRFLTAVSYHQNLSFSRHCSFHHTPPVSAFNMSEKALDHYRLPTDVRPRHYDLTIRTDLEKERFAGFVKIECVMCLFLLADYSYLLLALIS
jgi:hypothetical protein